MFVHLGATKKNRGTMSKMWIDSVRYAKKNPEKEKGSPQTMNSGETPRRTKNLDGPALITGRTKEWGIRRSLRPPVLQMACPHCGLVWMPRTPKPKVCRGCKRPIQYISTKEKAE